MSDFPLILASSSPRRKQLLAEAGYEFTVIPPSEAVESAMAAKARGLPAQDMVAQLALEKARDVVARIERGIVIACDTVAECRGEILGKPQGREDAQKMLKLLRGQEHRVYSGLCLWRRPDDDQRLQIEVTKLVMDPISDDQLEQYVDSGQWQGKAG